MTELFNLFKEFGQRLSLPVEQKLWGQIKDRKEVKNFLENSPQVLLLGTKADLSLAKEIFKTYPEVKIIIVEINPRVVEAAKKNIPTGAKMELINKDIFQLTPEDLGEKRPKLVIAKHFINFFEAPQLLLKIAAILPEGELIASVPAIGGVGKRTLRQLREKEDELVQKGILMKTEEELPGNWFEKGKILSFSFGNLNLS